MALREMAKGASSEKATENKDAKAKEKAKRKARRVPRIERQCAGLAKRRGSSPKTPTVIQMEAVECGAASLAILLAHYGRFVPLEELRLACAVNRDGSTAKNVLAAALNYGLEGRGRRMEVPPLMEIGHPVIIFWAFQHFMVVNGFERRRGRTVVKVNDPAMGPRIMDLREFDEGFTGIVLDLVPGEEFSKGGRPDRVLPMLRERMTGTGRGLLLALLAAALLVLPGVVTPFFTQYYLDQAYGTASWESLLPVLLGLSLCATATFILTQVQTFYLRLAEARTALVTSGRFMFRLLRLPMGFFMQRRAAELGRRVSSNQQVAQTLTRDLVMTSVNLLLIVVYGAVLLMQDVPLALLAMAVALCNLVILRVVMRSRVDAATALEAEEGRLMVSTLNTISSIETVKASGVEHSSFVRWSGFMAKATTEAQRLGVPTALVAVVPPMLAMVNSGLVMLIGGLRVADGAVTVGLLFSFQALLVTFTRPLTQLTNQAGQVQEMVAQLKRLRDAEHYDLEQAFVRDEGRTGRLSGALEFKNVDFAFGPLLDPHITDLSFEVGPGMRVALVGASGSGKSTVGRLAAGLVEPSGGQVLYDGSPRGEWTRQSLALSVSYVDQSTTLFEGSVRDNVCFWDTEVPDEHVVRALSDACVLDEVSRRAGGLNAQVSEGGANFSGGQRQRLELARALVSNPTLLVLDEATSALDTRTEQRVMDNLRRRGCALLLIAHRLSTIRDADLILVFEDGDVVESGRHDDLVAAGGVYARLVSSDDTEENE